MSQVVRAKSEGTYTPIAKAQQRSSALRALVIGSLSATLLALLATIFYAHATYGNPTNADQGLADSLLLVRLSALRPLVASQYVAFADHDRSVFALECQLRNGMECGNLLEALSRSGWSHSESDEVLTRVDGNSAWAIRIVPANAGAARIELVGGSLDLEALTKKLSAFPRSSGRVHQR